MSDKTSYYCYRIIDSMEEEKVLLILMGFFTDLLFVFLSFDELEVIDE